MTDITDTLAPNSSQLDAIDLIGGPRIFTVDRVVVNKAAEQPVAVHLVEFDRPWKPGRNMRRVLAYCWGNDSKGWAGKKVELYRDPDVGFGKDKVGGTRISRLSHIDGTKRAPVLNGNKPGTYAVEPLPVDAAPTQPGNDIEARIDALRAEWEKADDDRKAEIQAEVAALREGL